MVPQSIVETLGEGVDIVDVSSREEVLEIRRYTVNIITVIMMMMMMH